MNFLKSAWAWLSGKKTIIGATLMLAAAAASGQVPVLNLIPAIAHGIPAIAPAVPYLMGAGTLLGGTGLFHKVLKAAQNLPEESTPAT